MGGGGGGVGGAAKRFVIRLILFDGKHGTMSFVFGRCRARNVVANARVWKVVSLFARLRVCVANGGCSGFGAAYHTDLED